MADPLTIAIVFIFGTIIGSFLNVVGLRLLRDESIVWPASHCYQCDTPILPYDNIPVVSWLALRGKCRSCQKPISKQYPAIELLTGALFAAVYWKYGMTVQTLFLLFMFSNFIVILITDFKEQYIYDINSLGLIPFGLLYSFFDLGQLSPRDITLTFGDSAQIVLPQIFFSAIIAVVIAFLIFFVLNLLSTLMIGKAGFGEGDSRLLMGIGAFFGS